MQLYRTESAIMYKVRAFIRMNRSRRVIGSKEQNERINEADGRVKRPGTKIRNDR